MIAIKNGNTVIIGKDFADCATCETSGASGWKFFMMPGINCDIKVIGERSMDEAEKIVCRTLSSEGLKLAGYAAQRF